MKRSDGFTIIEVILFVAISTGLAALLMIGTGAALQRQQYRDSVQSFASFLRGQYARVISVENDERTDNMPCPLGGGLQPRGQSDCIIVGRYMSTNDGAAGSGARFQTYPVYALEGAGSTWNYRLGNADSEYLVEWSTRTRLSSQGGGSAPFSVLMYRDPELGTITIKTTTSLYASDVTALVNDSTTVSAREICVYDRGWMTGERVSVFLGARAGSADAVSVGSAQAGGCINA